MSKTKLILVAIIALVAAVGLYFYWQHQAKYPTTDDAYLQANIVSITPQIAGQVDQVSVAENQYVRAGDTLFTIKSDVFEANLKAAEAQLTLAQKEVDADADAAAGSDAQVVAAQATLDNAQDKFDRMEKLFKLGDITKAVMNQTTAERDQAKAQLASAKAAASGAKSHLGVIGNNNASVKVAQADVDIAKLNLGHATVKATADGWISNFTLRPGQFVQPGQSLFALVEDKDWWIDANFKETDIKRVQSGQPVSISVDMYPGVKIEGAIDSLGAGSGAVFSLVPAQNATGNWVKVTQRFPVRIKFDATKFDPAFQLRAGASVKVSVDTSNFKSPSK